MPGVVRLLLSVGASQVLEQSGQDCFQIVSKCSYPAAPGRWAIYLKPCPLEVAQAACKVLAGTHRAQRVTPPKAAAPEAPAVTPDRRADETERNVSAPEIAPIGAIKTNIDL